MHIKSTLLTFVLAGSIFAHGPNDGHKHENATANQQHSQGEVLGYGSLKYKVHKDWGKLDKTKYPIKNIHAMVELKDGNFIALCDDNKHNFLKYSPEGKLLDAWIKEYPGAHGLELFEKDGQEHFVVVDSGWAVHKGRQYRETGRVAITKANGQLVFALGHPQTVGAYEPGQKYMPCDAAVAPNGDIYIADGYGSQWVLHYNQHGQFIRKFGGNEDPDPKARLSNSHGISIDDRDPENLKLLVSSRNENTIKVYTMDGKYLESIDLPGAFGGQAVVHDDKLYVGVCWSKENGKGKRLKNSGFVAILGKE